MKGQITPINFMILLATVIIYMALLPVLNIFIDSTVATLDETPNEFTPMTILMLYAIPFVMLLAIVLTIFQYAIPRREGEGVY